VARLALPVLADASHRTDSGKGQEREPGHFQPQLVKHPPEGKAGRADPGQHRPARAAALHHIGGHTESYLDLSRHLAAPHQEADRSVDHQSILAAAGRTMTMGEITTTCDIPHQRLPTRGGLVDQQLKQLMKELGEAINESLSDSESIAEVVARIKEGGYDIFLVLEATIGVSKQGETTTDRSSLVSTLSTNTELKISDQDLKFLKSLRIKIDEDEDE
jgi:hypothetical protein